MIASALSLSPVLFEDSAKSSSDILIEGPADSAAYGKWLLVSACQAWKSFFIVLYTHSYVYEFSPQ